MHEIDPWRGVWAAREMRRDVKISVGTMVRFAFLINYQTLNTNKCDFFTVSLFNFKNMDPLNDLFTFIFRGVT